MSKERKRREKLSAAFRGRGVFLFLLLFLSEHCAHRYSFSENEKPFEMYTYMCSLLL